MFVLLLREYSAKSKPISSALFPVYNQIFLSGINSLTNLHIAETPSLFSFAKAHRQEYLTLYIGALITDAIVPQFL